MSSRGCAARFLLAGIIMASLLFYATGWLGRGPLEKDTGFTVPSGASLSSVAQQLEESGAITSATSFKLKAKLFHDDTAIQAGEFLLPAHASDSEILAILQHGKPIQRMVTVPEGMPSILVHERLMAEKLLTGEVPVPAEGSILPGSYDFQRGESRAALVGRMQAAMKKTVADLWPKRAKGIAVSTPEQAIILASIVEKETGVARERKMVAGLYSNRLQIGMRLQADPTIIYPITKGKPLGRRIKRSEITAVNGYNTYAQAGLPDGPITNPGRESIEAVLNPAKTSALYMVADGTGGHAFADSLDEHNANVRKWFDIRRKRGEM